MVAGLFFLSVLTALGSMQGALADTPAWLDAAKSPEERAALVLRELTEDEKVTLVFGYFGSNYTAKSFAQMPEARVGSAGYVRGVPRLGIPPLWETDAGLGVATQRETPTYRERTSLPSGLAVAASWNPGLAYSGGAMIGSEARDSGFNVMLAGGLNLMREPRNGRSFEYAGEDPLLAGVMVGEQVRGIQSRHVIATVKHFALNDQETGRMVVSSDIAEDQARMSDLLAFQLAIERGDPGAVMCAYNRVNGAYACENDWLLNRVLKGDWRYRRWVMSDWGAVHSTARAANAGLDQESAAVFDDRPYFGAPLKTALAQGDVSRARLDEMVRRILRSMFAQGLVEHPVAEHPAAIDFAAHAAIAQSAAEEGAVLLKNNGNLLPLTAGAARTIAVIGSYADAGVLSGGGSSQVFPRGGMAVKGLGPQKFPGPIVYFPDSPLDAMRVRLRRVRIMYHDGEDVESAVKLARDSDVVVLFAHQWSAETLDVSATLPDAQDRLIAAVARANPRTIVVLETGGPVLMPWLNEVDAVLEAWYPGTRGGEAIARLLLGEVAPSGRLPVSFPRTLEELPHPALPGAQLPQKQPFSAPYTEGAAVGYKWYDSRQRQPLFPFGHGLTYTRFAYTGLKVASNDGTVTATFDVKNVGAAAGKEVAKVYVGHAGGGWEAPKRLAGWRKIDLKPAGSARVTVNVDPRLLATWSGTAHGWRIAAGSYQIMIGASAQDIRATASVTLQARILPEPPVGP